MPAEYALADDALNSYLDDLAKTGHAEPHGISPALTLTIAALTSLDTRFSPEPATRKRIWRTVESSRHAAVAAVAPAASTSRPQPTTTHLRRPAWQRSPIRGRLSPALELMATAALILLMIATAIAGNQNDADTPVSLGAATATPTRAVIDQPLYFSTDAMQQLLTPIDPRSLRDRSDQPPITMASLHTFTGWALSGDGSTLATLEVGGPDAASTIISDAVTGVERSRIPVGQLGFQLNHDGSRILIPWARSDSVHGWLVYDTAGAKQLSSIPPETVGLSLPGWSRADLDVPDPTFQTLYRIVPVGPGAAPISATPGPYDQPTQLQAYDLTTGALVRSADLPGLVDELMGANPDPNSDLIQGQNRLQMAISPDGSKLAIPSLDGTMVAIVDTTSLTVTQEILLVPPTPDPSTPRADSATESRSIRAVIFAPDGQHLYVYGFDGTHTQGVQRVDMSDGSILANSFAGDQILQVLPSPDGQELFTVSRARYAGSSGEVILRRLDPNTLDLRARRTFSAFELPVLLLQPAAWHPLG